MRLWRVVHGIDFGSGGATEALRQAVFSALILAQTAFAAFNKSLVDTIKLSLL